MKMEDCSREDQLTEFLQNRDKIFVPTEGPSVKWLSKEPLPMKTEFTGDFAISLSPKSYYLLSCEDMGFKAASKGITRSDQNLNLLTFKAYFDCLFHHQK